MLEIGDQVKILGLYCDDHGKILEIRNDEFLILISNSKLWIHKRYIFEK